MSQTQQKTTSQSSTSVEIILEIDHPKNSDVYFLPIDQSLRSQILPHRSGPGLPSQLTPFQRIPGERLHLNVKGRKGRITDALADPENEQLVRGLQAAGRSLPIRKEYGGPKRTRVFDNLSDEDVNTWLWYMRRLVENGEANVVQGEVPERDEIHKRGQVRRVSHDLRAGGTRYIEPQPA